MSSCAGCDNNTPSSVQREYSTLKNKAIDYAKEQKQTVFIYKNETGQYYCTAEYFYANKPGQFVEGITQIV